MEVIIVLMLERLVRRPRMSRQAAPMQKRVEPLALAVRAAERTASMVRILEAWRPVE